jgi:serine protease Do
MRPAVLTRSTDHWRALRPRRTPEIAVRSGLGRARGALVGAAKAANGALDVGDVITSLNGEPVRDFRALARLTGGMRPGTAVEVSVLRRGEAKTVALRLGKLPDEPLQAADSVGRPTSRQGGVNCHARLCR